MLRLVLLEHKKLRNKKGKLMKNKSILLIIVIILITIIGCTTIDNASLLHQNYSAKYIYKVGHEQFGRRDYYGAIKTFHMLNSQYPLNKYTELGNLDLIYAYYYNNESEMALTLGYQFIKKHPVSIQLGYIYYIMGVINFNNNRDFLQRHLPYNVTQHDPKNFLKAFYDFKYAIIYNPKANYIKDARKRMVYINDVVGKYQYNIAKFYFDRKIYRATINRVKTVIKNYPQSQVIEKALVLLIQSYDILKMSYQTRQYLKLLKINFPNNSYLKLFKNKA